MSLSTTHTRLLLVDDDLITRIVFRSTLEKAGFIVDDAENGQIAIDKFKQIKYAVILMDYNMPGLDGAAVTKTIRSIEGNDKKTVIIGVTAHIDPKIKAICLSSGMDTVINKPIDINQISQLVTNLFNTQTTPD